MNLLAEYAGYTDYKDFENSLNKQELEDFFADQENYSTDYWRRSEHLCHQISKSPELLLHIHHRLLVFPKARKFFLENHPMRDWLGTVYDHYFTTYLKYNQTNEARIFAYGFLFLSAFLQQNTEMMDLYGLKMRKIPLDDDVHVIPAGMKFGVEMLYADYIQDDNAFRKAYSAMKKWREIYVPASKASVCSFEYSVLELFIFTNRTKEMKCLADFNTAQIHPDQAYIPEDRKATHNEVWKIIQAKIYAKAGEKDKAQCFLAQTDLSKLGVGWQKYYSIIYYQTCKELSEENFENQELEKLLQETNFWYFRNEFNKDRSSKIIS